MFFGVVQAAKLGADAFAFQFPSSLEDIDRVRSSIAEEEAQRTAAVEQATASRNERQERERAAANRQLVENPSQQGQHSNFFAFKLNSWGFHLSQQSTEIGSI